jgi:hypothetical protein
VVPVPERFGSDLERAAATARRVIHSNDVDGLKQLLSEHPALLSWNSDTDRGGLLGFATGAYGDAFGEQREQWFTRKACAEVLIDAGAAVAPSVVDGLIDSRAAGLLQLFHQKGLLPPALKFLAARGDRDGVRSALSGGVGDRLTVTEAFLAACRFHHRDVAALLLERAVALDPVLGRQLDGSVGREAFIASVIENEPVDLNHAIAAGPWRTFVMGHVLAALHQNDKTALVDWLQREPWLLDDTSLWFQNRIIEITTFTTSLTRREAFIAALFERDPAILHRRPPPPSQAIEHAITYANTHLIPLLTRIWPLPDDLPHAAGLGDLARVRHWLDTSSPPQRLLDVALAYAVINRHFEVADVLLQHGADINTEWNSHEPASILHHLVFLPDPYPSMQFLIDRGVDLTIRDYRWDSTARGWAQYALQDEKMVRFLEEAERRR